MNIRRQASGIENNKIKDNGITVSQLFDIKTLDLYCRYVISENQNIRLSSLSLVQNLFKKVDEKAYGKDQERITRIQFIKRGLEARVDKHLKEKEVIIQYINGGLLNDQLLDISTFDEISDEELAYINDQSCVISDYYFIDSEFEDIHKLAAELKSTTGVNRTGIIEDIKEAVSRMNSTFNKIDSSINREPEFSTIPESSEMFDQTFRDIYSRETSPSRTLKTGITGLNMMIDGGLQAGRVYMVFGTAATGKSFLAEDLALQVAKYNRNYKTQDPTKRPCIVFLTMENSVQENISRMFNMIVGKPISVYERYDDALREFRDALDHYSGNRINIYMEYQPNLSKTTNYLYTLIDKVKARNEEPILMIVDHIKRIRSVEATKDLRQDLGSIVNEFKAFANIMDIPVFSISHLNREAAKNIGESKNKKDIIRTLGTENVSDSLLMIDNTDVGIILNKESDSEGNLYMGFKTIKTRTQCTLDLFFQPFMENCSLKLIEDVDSPIPLFRKTLMDDRGGPIKNYGNDYTRNRRTDDDDEMFGSSNMNSSSSGPSIESILSSVQGDEQVMSDNQPIVIQEPSSEPMFIPPPPIVGNMLTPWEEELISIKYRTDSKPAVYFLDEDGLVINDGVEDCIY